MSETVKIIVEVPRETYLELKSGFMTRNALASAEAIANGTPLDNVKAEFVNLYPKNYMGGLELGGAECHFSLNKVLKILESIGKEESEE